jgi:hypothetical protein
MTYDNWLNQPNDDDWNDSEARIQAEEICFSDDEWHPAIEAEYREYFDRTYEPSSSDLPAKFDSWLEDQSGEEIAVIVSQWHFKQ